MAYLEPSDQQMAQFANDKHVGAILMLNLLRYKDTGSSRSSYQQYVERVKPMIEACGGKIVARSTNRLTLIGPDTWDETILVMYPSKEALMEMLGSEDYREISHLRTAALADSRLYMTSASPDT
jgi:uncharacterized protein (DUF1330 family)